MTSKEKVGSEVIEHWYTLVSGQQFSSQDFYAHIEESVNAQKVPALDSSRVDLAEGGILSERREYLRYKRERLTFDVCAAPVGVNYFFSYRFYLEPIVIKPWEILAAVAALLSLVYASMRYVGPFLGPVLLLVVLVAYAWLMRNAIGMGLRDVDAALIKAPVLGPIYERFFRKDSYYRQDVRMAYCSIVSGIVKQEVERVTAAKGVQLLREYTYSPIFDELYNMKEWAPRSEPDAEPSPV